MPIKAVSWQSRVYAKKELQKSNDEWENIRSEIISQYKNKCFRCDKKFPKYKLTVHHIIPRKDGGADNNENLLPLCNPCHDIVEEKECKSKVDILKTIHEDIQSKNNDYINTDEKINWHCIVYGGQKAKGRIVVSE